MSEGRPPPPAPKTQDGSLGLTSEKEKNSTPIHGLTTKVRKVEHRYRLPHGESQKNRGRRGGDE